MSHTHKSQVSKSSKLYREDIYTGWNGESCWAQHGRAWFKKMIHRVNRRNARRTLRVSINTNLEN